MGLSTLHNRDRIKGSYNFRFSMVNGIDIWSKTDQNGSGCHYWQHCNPFVEHLNFVLLSFLTRTYTFLLFSFELSFIKGGAKKLTSAVA